MSRQRSVAAELTEVEARIAELETSYVADTKQKGNVYRGWGPQRKDPIPGQDERIFSLSSKSSPLVKNKRG